MRFYSFATSTSRTNDINPGLSPEGVLDEAGYVMLGDGGRYDISRANADGFLRDGDAHGLRGCGTCFP